MSSFTVLLGPDFSGKSTILSALRTSPGFRVVSYDDADVADSFPAISKLRRLWVSELFERRAVRYSREVVLSVLEAIVLHLRDQALQPTRGGTVVVDSYYYKLLAKCRLTELCDQRTQQHWRSFQQPKQIVYLDVDPMCAWERSERGAGLHSFEHYGAVNLESFVRFQSDLRSAMLEEARGVPIKHVDGNGDAATVLQKVRGILQASATTVEGSSWLPRPNPSTLRPGLELEVAPRLEES
jgi:thymidylate kinase